jgi:hypothetical protein
VTSGFDKDFGGEIAADTDATTADETREFPGKIYVTEFNPALID